MYVAQKNKQRLERESSGSDGQTDAMHRLSSGLLFRNTMP